jgi:hypothetical protein
MKKRSQKLFLLFVLALCLVIGCAVEHYPGGLVIYRMGPGPGGCSVDWSAAPVDANYELPTVHPASNPAPSVDANEYQ